MYHILPDEIRSGKRKVYETVIRLDHKPMGEQADSVIVVGGASRTKIQMDIVCTVENILRKIALPVVPQRSSLQGAGRDGGYPFQKEE